MDIKIQFKISRKIHPKFQSLTIGKYIIEPIPSNSPGLKEATNMYMLRFQDEMREGERMTNPKAEGELFLACLSLFIGSKLHIESLMMNSVNTPQIIPAGTYNNYERTAEELLDLNNLTQKLMAKDMIIAKQFIRACEVYRVAMNLIPENITLSYFLLTISIECLSNVVILTGGNCDKFIGFILKYVQDKSDLKDEEEWKEFLKEIYYNHRSGFTHGGKDIPEAVELADRLNRVYVKNMIQGKEVKTPGLKWFESVVRRALIGFLESKECETADSNDWFKEFSLEDGAVMLKAKRALAAFQPITEKDVELD